jgi:hypothetical protein
MLSPTILKSVKISAAILPCPESQRFLPVPGGKSRFHRFFGNDFDYPRTVYVIFLLGFCILHTGIASCVWRKIEIFAPSSIKNQGHSTHLSENTLCGFEALVCLPSRRSSRYGSPNQSSRKRGVLQCTGNFSSLFRRCQSRSTWILSLHDVSIA